MRMDEEGHTPSRVSFLSLFIIFIGVNRIHLALFDGKPFQASVGAEPGTDQQPTTAIQLTPNYNLPPEILSITAGDIGEILRSQKSERVHFRTG
jgi:hypothetical protein